MKRGSWCQPTRSWSMSFQPDPAVGNALPSPLRVQHPKLTQAGNRFWSLSPCVTSSFSLTSLTRTFLSTLLIISERHTESGRGDDVVYLPLCLTTVPRYAIDDRGVVLAEPPTASTAFFLSLCYIHSLQRAYHVGHCCCFEHLPAVNQLRNPT